MKIRTFRAFSRGQISVMPEGHRQFLIDTDDRGHWQVHCRDCSETLSTMPDHEVWEFAKLAVAHHCAG